MKKLSAIIWVIITFILGIYIGSLKPRLAETLHLKKEIIEMIMPSDYTSAKEFAEKIAVAKRLQGNELPQVQSVDFQFKSEFEIDSIRDEVINEYGVRLSKKGVKIDAKSDYKLILFVRDISERNSDVREIMVELNVFKDLYLLDPRAEVFNPVIINSRIWHSGYLVRLQVDKLGNDTIVNSDEFKGILYMSITGFLESLTNN